MARDQYHTVKEVADRLKLSEATVRGWIKRGDLRAIEIGKGWRIADSQLEVFLCSHAMHARKTAGSASAEYTDTMIGRDGGA